MEREGSAPGTTTLSSTAAALVLLGLFFAIVMAGMDALVVNTALTNISRALHQTNGLAFVVAVYLISSTVSIPIFSKLSDRYSRRNVLVAGLVIFIGGSALAGLSQNLGELIAFRGVQGFGTGGFLPVGIAMVSVLFPPAQRARLTGILSGAGGLSIVLGPIVGSYIVGVTTWRWVFYVNLPFGVAAIAILLTAVGPLRPATRGRVDYVGAALLSGWVAALMLPLVEVTEDGWGWWAPGTLALLADAALTFALFVAWELRESDPLVPLRLLGRRTLAACGGVALFNGIVVTSGMTLISVFVGVVLLHGSGNAADDVRDLTYFFALPMILGAGLCGLLLARASYRTVVAPALALAAAATWALTSLSTGTALWVLRFGVLPVGGIALPLIPMGFGLGIALAAALIIVPNEVPQAEVGSAIGFVRFLQSLGGAVGLSLLTAYQQWAAGGLVAPEAALVRSYDQVYGILALVVVAALAFSLFLRGRVLPTPAEPTPAPAAQVGGAPP